MKKTLLTLSVAALATTSVFATDTAACAGCHGASFEKAALGKSKIVKDMTKADIIAALKGYKDGSYGGPMKGVMKGQVTKLSDADIEAIASQIAGGAEAPKAAAEKAATTVEKATEAAKTEVKATVTEKAVDAASKAIK